MPVRSVICPACQKINDGFPSGIITLSGEFLKPHKDEILQLIRKEEVRAKKINPLRWSRDDKFIRVKWHRGQEQ